ncbi:aldo/keto reductase [Streptomyces sp. NPDC020379]|uniref:aldo/keto reductase n=1 Tax=Streptomyces sp. NPDC020379 TaxID=3365071 RepID=UPI003790D327
MSTAIPGGPTARAVLGRSGVPVTRLGFGGAALGGLFRPVSEDQAVRAVRAAWDAGLRYFDTAPHYGAGLSEQRLGLALSGLSRGEFTVSTKVGRLLTEGTGADGREFTGAPDRLRVRDYSRDGVLRSVDESLRRLGLDRVDVLYIHDPDEHWQQAVTEAYPTLARLRDDRVVGAIGVGMNQTAMLSRFVTETDLDVVLCAGRCTLLDDSARRELLPLCERRGVAVVAAGVYNSGILADPTGTPHYDYAPAPPWVRARADGLAGLCAAHGVPLPAAALAWTARHPAVTSVLVGMRSAEEVRANVGWARADVPPGLCGGLAGMLRGDAGHPGSGR